MKTPGHVSCTRRVFLQGIFVSTATQAQAAKPAPPMRGPDFALDLVSSWNVPAQGAGVLHLRDGSRWLLDMHREDAAIQVHFIEDAIKQGRELLVSGDRRTGVIERTAASRKLAVQRVGEPKPDGRYPVLFFGPPSFYYLRMDRPGAAEQLEVLRRSLSAGGFLDRPNVLVGIDTVASEIVAVRGL